MAKPDIEPTDLEARLKDGLARAAELYPGVVVDPSVFADYVRERYEQPRQLEPDRLADLALACAAALGDPTAIAVFERQILPALGPGLDRLRLTHFERGDLGQRLREELFVRTPDRRPKIAEYSGRGDLAGWLRITATRLGLKVIRARGKHEDSDSALEEHAAQGEDPELALIRAEYRPVFKTSFQIALDALEDRERLLLKQHFLDGLTVDQLGAVHHVHRATAARWLVSAREALLKRLRGELMNAANISSRECDSVMDLVKSGLGTTLRRRLRDSD